MFVCMIFLRKSNLRITAVERHMQARHKLIFEKEEQHGMEWRSTSSSSPCGASSDVCMYLCMYMFVLGGGVVRRG